MKLWKRRLPKRWRFGNMQPIMRSMRDIICAFLAKDGVDRG
jgi:hypothetical protein